MPGNALTLKIIIFLHLRLKDKKRNKMKKKQNMFGLKITGKDSNSEILLRLRQKK